MRLTHVGEAMMVLRGQLEAALILLYLIDAEDDKEFHERATRTAIGCTRR